jgi:hypothetical protein
MRLRRSSTTEYLTGPCDPTHFEFDFYYAACCILVTAFLQERDMLKRAEGGCMFETYLNEKRDRLLVIEKGHPIPVIENSGRWRKKKRAVAVSDEIKLALQQDGFYWRRLAEHRKSSAVPLRAASPDAANNQTRLEAITGFFKAGQNRTDTVPNR